MARTGKRRTPTSKTPESRRLSFASFNYPEDLGWTLPSLVLAIPVPDDAFRDDADYRGYRFKSGRTWHQLAHQTGGHACHQHYMHATLLTPLSADIQLRMNALSKQWYGTNAGVFGPTLNELGSYRADLARLFGADCNVSYPSFEEGIYPIDTEHGAKLAADALPKDLDDLIEWKDGFQRACGCIGRWKLYVISQNSD